jgi:alpha-beta hydrolase superfamily lysophospholipase
MTVAREFNVNSNEDSLALQGYQWEPDHSPRGIVVIAHGKGEHARRYQLFAEALNKARYLVYALDHRGHGGSPGPQGLGDFGSGGWNGLVNDIVQLIEMARRDQPDLPLALFGHSMGSFAAQQLILDHSSRIDSVVLSGSAAIDKLLEVMAESLVAPTDAQEPGSDFGPLNKPFEPARTPFDWLSRDKGEVDKYMKDPLCGFDFLPESTMSMAMAAQQTADPAALAQIRKDLPILLLAGDADPVTGNLEFLNVLEQRYRAAGISDISKLYYSQGRHEMLNEINRERVMFDTILWLDEHTWH